MYDVNFCFKNFISEVNIGVLTNIRITHKSIGMTNDQWEKNKNIFVDKYKPYLPTKVKFKSTDKLNIMISCLFFQNYTGSEMYVFELAKNLISQNCNVTVVASETDGPLVSIATKLGVIVKNIKETPGYKLGDGKWIVNTPEGPRTSTPNNFYKISEVHYDIIHCQHKPIVDVMNSLYPTIDKISTIHSEVIELENPVIHNSIKKYIAIRPEIKQHLVDKFKISENDIKVIYNPIDDVKFKPENKPSENSVLFVGTIDYLRKKSIFDLVNYTKDNNKDLWLVGKNQSDYLPELLKYPHVKYYEATPNVDNFIHRCSETAGILLGRTTIEGWMCGKPGWIYNVNSNGDIIDKEFFEVPNDLEKFKSGNVTSKIKTEYLNILNT
jgi:glycosyltransferase involved in cell wall biosynthesis